MSDWKRHRPAFIIALACLAIAIVLTVWQGLQPSDTLELKTAIENQTQAIIDMSTKLDRIISLLEANNVATK